METIKPVHETTLTLKPIVHAHAIVYSGLLLHKMCFNS